MVFTLSCSVSSSQIRRFAAIRTHDFNLGKVEPRVIPMPPCAWSADRREQDSRIERLMEIAKLVRDLIEEQQSILASLSEQDKERGAFS